jgi:hypothetical protein
MNPLHRVLLAATWLAVGSISASAQTRLVAIDGASIVDLDPATAAVINTRPLIGGVGVVGAITYEAGTGAIFLSSTSNDELWSLNDATGVATLIGSYNLGTPVYMHGLTIDDGGQLYGYSLFTGMGARFFRIDRLTGQATPISDPGISGFGDLAFASSTGTMYFADIFGSQLLTLDRTSGAATVVGPFGPAAAQLAPQLGMALPYDPQFGLYATNNVGTPSIWRIDVVTGNATFLSNLALSNPIAMTFFDANVSTGTAFCPGDGTGTACPCGNSSALGSHSGCLSSLNVGGQLMASGAANLTNDTLVLHGTSMPNSFALYFQGTTQQSGGLGTVFGDGLRCAAGSIMRLGATMNAGGSSQYPFGAFPAIHVKGNITSAGTRTYQAWYRNAAAFCTPSTFNLTNGWQLSWVP